MIKPADQPNVYPMQPPTGPGERLPYAIELWNLPRTEVERVIGRAASVVLARAIFTAAEREHLGRHLVLRRGTRVVSESG